MALPKQGLQHEKPMVTCSKLRAGLKRAAADGRLATTLQRTFGSPEQALRSRAVDALARAAVRGKLVELLKQDLRTYAVDVLRHATVDGQLIELLKTDDAFMQDLRIRAVDALGRAAVEGQLSQLLKLDNVTVQDLRARALDVFKHAATEHKLVELLKSDESFVQGLRMRAVDALAQAAMKGHLAKLLKWDDMPLQDFRKRAADELAQAAISGQLATILKGDEMPLQDFRKRAADELAQASISGQLATALKGDDMPIQDFRERALDGLARATINGQLTTLLQGEDLTIQTFRKRASEELAQASISGRLATLLKGDNLPSQTSSSSIEQSSLNTSRISSAEQLGEELLHTALLLHEAESNLTIQDFRKRAVEELAQAAISGRLATLLKGDNLPIQTSSSSIEQSSLNSSRISSAEQFAEGLLHTALLLYKAESNCASSCPSTLGTSGASTGEQLGYELLQDALLQECQVTSRPSSAGIESAYSEQSRTGRIADVIGNKVMDGIVTDLLHSGLSDSAPTLCREDATPSISRADSWVGSGGVEGVDDLEDEQIVDFLLLRAGINLSGMMKDQLLVPAAIPASTGSIASLAPSISRRSPSARAVEILTAAGSAKVPSSPTPDVESRSKTHNIPALAAVPTSCSSLASPAPSSRRSAAGQVAESFTSFEIVKAICKAEGALSPEVVAPLQSQRSTSSSRVSYNVDVADSCASQQIMREIWDAHTDLVPDALVNDRRHQQSRPPALSAGSQTSCGALPQAVKDQLYSRRSAPSSQLSFVGDVAESCTSQQIIEDIWDSH